MTKKPELSRAELLVAMLHFAIGFAVACVAGAVLFTYHNGLPELRLPGGERLQYDSAWVVLLDGLALLFYAVSLRGLAKLCAAATLIISGLCIVGYLLPHTLPVHPLLANPWLAGLPADYPAMGAVTALIAFILGAALVLLLPAAQRSPGRTVVLAILASTVLALSLLVAFGAWSGSTLATQSLQLNGDERINSLTFIVLGATLLAYTLGGSEHERLALGRFAPAIVGLAVFVSVLVVWRAALSQEARYVRSDSALIASAAAGALERDLHAHIAVLERLAERMSFHTFNETIWQQEGESILRNVGEFRTIAWSGPDYVIRWSSPPESAVLGYNILSDSARGAAAQLARTTHETTLSPFSDLIIGGRGIVVYVPSFEGDQFRGTVSSALGSNWLNAFLGERFAEHYFELLENGRVQQSVKPPSPKAGSDWSVDVPVALYNAHWVLRVTPTREYLAQQRSALPEAGLALGTALSLLLTLATYFYQAARRRARALNLANVQLIQDNERRREAEQRLRESEQRNQLIVNSVKDCAIYMLETDGRIASWNAGAQTLYGYWPDEILGRHFSILYPGDRKVPPEDDLIVAARIGWFEEECWHLRKDSTQYCADDMISAIRNEAGGLEGFAVITRDATLRIELREQTERARDHYLALFSSFPNLVWQSDTKGSCDYVNQAWLDYTGRAMEHQHGAEWLESVHPDDRAAWRHHIDDVFPSERPFELEFRLRRADGEYGSMICSGRPYRDMQGQFAGYICSCYDNTARRAAERDLKESEERYQRVTGNVPGMVFTLEQAAVGRYRFTYVSQGATAITGLDPDVLMGDIAAFEALLAVADRAALVATLDDSAERLTTWLWAGRLLPSHDAAEKWISIRARPRIASQGTTTWDGIVFDDTQARLAQLEIERSREEARALSRHLQTIREEEKARIAREVHDELGSTLTGLKIDLDWLIEHPAGTPDSTREKYTAMMTLLGHAVAATRKIVTDLRPSILDDLGLASAMRWQIAEYQKHSEMHFELETPEPDLAIDRSTALVLFRIFQETITNVARHARASEVHVALTSSEATLVLSIHDNGVGIAAAEMLRPTAHGIRGMRERALQIGGTLVVTGEPGAGTTVVVTVPRHSTAESADRRAAERPTERA